MAVNKVVETIQIGAVGIALVVDEDRRLIGTITDGDVRRAVLSDVKMSDNVGKLFDHRSEPYQKPTVASVGTTADELLQLMQERSLRQIPLLDNEGRVVELALLTELVEDDRFMLSAVVMAGGFGKRLQPATDQVPKPMLPLKGRPLMERTIEQLRKAGIDQVFVTTHYKPEVITNHFHDGREFGVDIQYVNETEPLGTAGALGLIDEQDHTSLVINGDILTQLDFRMMLDFHQAHKAVMTVGIRKYEFQIPYGVVETDGVSITHLIEKPAHSCFVNAGIYLLEPVVYRYISGGSHFDMTDLIDCLLKNGQPVIGFPIQEYWLDIGQIADYEKAQAQVGRESTQH